MALQAQLEPPEMPNSVPREISKSVLPFMPPQLKDVKVRLYSEDTSGGQDADIPSLEEDCANGSQDASKAADKDTFGCAKSWKLTTDMHESSKHDRRALAASRIATLQN